MIDPARRAWIADHIEGGQLDGSDFHLARIRFAVLDARERCPQIATEIEGRFFNEIDEIMREHV